MNKSISKTAWRCKVWLIDARIKPFGQDKSEEIISRKRQRNLDTASRSASRMQNFCTKSVISFIRNPTLHSRHSQNARHPFYASAEARKDRKWCRFSTPLIANPAGEVEAHPYDQPSLRCQHWYAQPALANEEVQRSLVTVLVITRAH